MWFLPFLTVILILSTSASGGGGEKEKKIPKINKAWYSETQLLKTPGGTQAPPEVWEGCVDQGPPVGATRSHTLCLPSRCCLVTTRELSTRGFTLCIIFLCTSMIFFQLHNNSFYTGSGAVGLVCVMHCLVCAHLGQGAPMHPALSLHTVGTAEFCTSHCQKGFYNKPC